MFGLMATISWHNVRAYARTHRSLDESLGVMEQATTFTVSIPDAHDVPSPAAQGSDTALVPRGGAP